MNSEKGEFVTGAAILTRRLRKGKNYDDFRKAWYHTTGFGVNESGGYNTMLTLINIFDPSEIIVLGFSTVTLEQLKNMTEIDVKYRGAHPLDDIIEPEIDRKFCVLISEDDFSAAGNVPYKPPSIAGKETNLEEINKFIQDARKIFAEAAKKRDEINEARRRGTDGIK